jgi:hypothetical protein
MTGAFQKVLRRIAIVTPVYNDWASLSRLISEIETCEMPEDIGFSLFIVNDGSTEPPAIKCPLQPLQRIAEIELINLACNLGHQRAIAVAWLRSAPPARKNGRNALPCACMLRRIDAATIVDTPGPRWRGGGVIKPGIL